MKRGRKRVFYLVLALVLLVQLACERGDLFIKKIQCEAKGYIWHQNYSQEEGEWYYSCDPPPAPTPTRDTSNIGGCIAYEPAYAWSYENFRSSSGTGGVSCNARFVFTNNSDEPLRLILYTFWDNNAMNLSGWDTYSVPPGGEWEKPVSTAIYKDGVTTSDWVLRLLVIRDIPACSKFLVIETQTLTWEEIAWNLDNIPCP